ncbi:MAG: response regulator [Eubacterium sp.]|nr:response regulator [Eubacterium sp.]
MKTGLKDRFLGFYTKEKELDITLFKILGTAGILISIVGALQSLFTAGDYISSLINVGAALASVCLLIFVDRTKKYIIGYLITSVGIFMFLFGWLFLEMGGLYGSMPYFFMFGIVFTLMMYRGLLLYIVEMVQIMFYVWLCYFSFLNPQYVKAFETEKDQIADQIAGILLSSLGIGMIFIMYIWEYRKQQRIALESSRAKSVLLANISHEIRTPINMLLGMNEMILRESENTQINEYAQNVDNAGRQLLFLVNQFLDLTRIDMGKEEMFYEDFSFPEIINSLQVFYSKEAGKKGIEFVFEDDRSIPVYIYGDKRKLSQILSNLLSNAVKYTSEGLIVFSVKMLSKDDNGCLIHFEVSDTGMGITEKDQKKIFESFERSDIIRNRSIEGTGLGLAISSKLAEMMNTEIKVKSTYGEGSVFWFDLYMENGSHAADVMAQQETFIAPEARILAVDDNNMNLVVLKALLKRTMIKVDFAESAAEGCEMYQKKDYDLVFMDYMMPEIDGIEAMKMLRRIDEKRKKKVPIVVLTADATPQMKEIFLKEGFDDYLLKPVESDLLEKSLMKNLPKNLVTVVETEETVRFDEATMRRFTNILKEYDISIGLALKHLSGDMLQFSRIADYFIKSADENMEKLKSLIDEKDYAAAAYIFHSVKGNSGNVGGEDLFYSARRLESRAKEGDGEYVEAAMPLFIMKWMRVKEGLGKFLVEFEAAKEEKSKSRVSSNEKSDKGETIEKLLEALRMGNGSPAVRYLDEIDFTDEKLKERIKILIKDIEFDRAEELIREEMERRGR